MNIKEALSKFFSEITSKPEDKVNELSCAVVSVCKREVPPPKKLEVLQNLAKSHPSIQAHFDLFYLSLRERSEYKDGVDDQISTYIVAAGDAILALLGEDPGSGKYRTERDDERVRRSCELQRNRINWRNIEEENLRNTLWQSFGIKMVWKTFDDPRWQQCRITELELQARNEWNKANPMPKSS